LVASSLPSASPSLSSDPSFAPSAVPTALKSNPPSLSLDPSSSPSLGPSVETSGPPSVSFSPSSVPSDPPSLEASFPPSMSAMPSSSPSSKPSVEASGRPSVSPTISHSSSPSSSPSVSLSLAPTDQSVCGDSFDNTCIELVAESCSASNFNCFSPYVTIKDARDDRVKVKVWQLVNEVESGVCPPDSPESEHEYQVLYSRIRNDKGELECRKKNEEKCEQNRIEEKESFCKDGDTHTEVELWINTKPDEVKSVDCADLRKTPDPSFCYFKYKLLCSESQCDP